ncbi:uncharacterized protein LOC120159757 [Hibiscus syriacus]|uniref:uncharacterized protein LOC120159757 n=1 Tax=Hibiscus syriacus TaxID=106335 RepID=UPI0019212757|nr:uncharacterized protein LOC120159757 [Hibiscus syriacus]
METRIKSDNSDRFIVALSDDLKFAVNYEFVEGGRIWIFWRNHLMFSIFRSCDQAITITRATDGHSIAITAIYGSNNGVVRRGLWEHLSTVGKDIGPSSWLVSGDFNIIAKAEESSDFDILGIHCTSDMKDFQDCLEGLDLMDHPFFGPLFTWPNKQECSYLARKLDRILVNDQWLLDFPDSFVEFKAQGVSDHCLGLMWTHKLAMTRKPKPFKFFNCWTNHEHFLATVRDSWQQQCGGSAMNCLFNKLKRLKPLLRGFNKQFFSDISGRVRLKRAELEYIQIFNLAHSSQRRIDDERRIHTELVDLEVAESDFYRQHANVSCLRENDLNTKFFYQRVQANTKKNTIRVIRGEDGHIHESFEGISAELVGFFTSIIGTPDPFVRGCSIETLRDLLNYTLPDGTASSLTKEAAWDIIGSDFTSAVRYFFHSFCLLPAFNATALVLIPKSLNACSVKDFRPISCCSVVYKTITRVLVNRLTPYFPDMISHNQSAFVKGRNIVDNTLLAQEIVKGLKLNAMKTEFFSCGLNDNALDLIQSATGFRLAHLLVRYLGVPLVTRKLTGRDCSALLERVKGCDAPARGISVGWNQVCSLKSDGGLGLRDLALWSKTCCLLLIRNILANEGSLWIAWIQEYCFKTVSFWEVEIRAHFSWILKKLLKLREVARSMFLPSADLSLVRGKLPTKDRLVWFGLTLEAGCVVCGIGLKSRDHLFAECPFARDVWNVVLISCGLRSDLFS